MNKVELAPVPFFLLQIAYCQFLKTTNVVAFILEQEKYFTTKKQQNSCVPEYIPFLHLIGRAVKKQAEKYLEVKILYAFFLTSALRFKNSSRRAMRNGWTIKP